MRYILKLFLSMQRLSLLPESYKVLASKFSRKLSPGTPVVKVTRSNFIDPAGNSRHRLVTPLNHSRYMRPMCAAVN